MMGKDVYKGFPRANNNIIMRPVVVNGDQKLSLDPVRFSDKVERNDPT